MEPDQETIDQEAIDKQKAEEPQEGLSKELRERTEAGDTQLEGE